MKPILITTARLYLRNAHEGDAENLFRNYFSSIDNSKFLTRQPHKDSTQTALFLNKWCSEGWENDSLEFAWVIALNKTNEAVGTFIVMEEGHKVQIHYGIGTNFQGQGLITEAGNAIIDWLRKQPEIQRIWTVCDLDNIASMRVLEKLGFKKEGILEKWLLLPSFGDQARDCSIYAFTQM